jgi:predicted restriction endonuclease
VRYGMSSMAIGALLFGKQVGSGERSKTDLIIRWRWFYLLGHLRPFDLTKQRAHQTFFREAIISSYDETCCVTGLRIRECLIASHIVPWNVDEEHRADPTNGLCLSSTFDRLFDAGLITINDDSTVCVSEILLRTRIPSEQELICRYHGTPMIMPKRFMPSMDRLSWHRSNVFRG